MKEFNVASELNHRYTIEEKHFFLFAIIFLYMVYFIIIDTYIYEYMFLMNYIV